jgi:hypothetical protein
MKGKNRLVRIFAPLLVIGAIISMAGIAGAFELKVSGNSQSVPLDNGFSQNGPKITNPGTVAPAVTPTATPTTTPVVTPKATPTPTPTKNITYYEGIIGNATSSQAGMLDKISVMLNRSGMANPFNVKETPALPGNQDLSDKSPGATPEPTVTQPANSPAVNASVNNTKNQTPVVNNPVTVAPTLVPVPTGPSPSVSGRDVSGNGTIVWIAMDNGFYGIVTDDGQQFLPGKIDPAFRIDGLRVSFRGMARPDKQGEHPWGIPLDLIELARVGSIIETKIVENGTIRYVDLKNGTYGISADNGLEYLPLNLNSSYKTDGLRVNFSAYPADRTTTVPWESPVRLITIAGTGEPLDATIAQTGNVTWVNLGGGFYGIMGDDGNLYIPSNLDKKFMKNEFQVDFTAEKINDNLGRSRLWGIPVEILDIQKHG